MSAIRISLLLACFCLQACAPSEVLETKTASVPAGVDLSGHWRIRPDSSADQDRIRQAIGRASGSDADIIPIPSELKRQRTAAASSSKRGRGGLVQVFLQSGENLKVTQTLHGIFIAFDRSVVEEFRFGENREVSVGEIVAQRVSGWDGNRYVVETLDRNGMKLTEQFYLSEDGDTLHRHIVLRTSDKKNVTLRQSFSRNSDSS